MFLSIQAGKQSLKRRSRLMKIHSGSPLLYTQFHYYFRVWLVWVSAVTRPNPHCVHQSPGLDFRSTVGKPSLLLALYLDMSTDSDLKTDFLPFFLWVIETADFFVACGVRVFSILTPMMFQQCTTAFSETEACEEKRFKPAGFVGWLKPPSKFSIFSPSLTQVWKQHLSQNGNMLWEFLLWKS